MSGLGAFMRRRRARRGAGEGEGELSEARGERSPVERSLPESEDAIAPRCDGDGRASAFHEAGGSERDCRHEGERSDGRGPLARLALPAAALAALLAFAILGSVASLGRQLADIHPALGWAFFALVVACLAVGVAWPIARVLSRPLFSLARLFGGGPRARHARRELERNLRLRADLTPGDREALAALCGGGDPCARGFGRLLQTAPVPGDRSRHQGRREVGVRHDGRLANRGAGHAVHALRQPRPRSRHRGALRLPAVGARSRGPVRACAQGDVSGRRPRGDGSGGDLIACRGQRRGADAGRGDRLGGARRGERVRHGARGGHHEEGAVRRRGARSICGGCGASPTARRFPLLKRNGVLDDIRSAIARKATAIKDGAVESARQTWGRIRPGS